MAYVWLLQRARPMVYAVTTMTCRGRRRRRSAGGAGPRLMRDLDNTPVGYVVCHTPLDDLRAYVFGSLKPQFRSFSASWAPAFTPVAGLSRTTPMSVRPFLTASNSRQCLATSV